MNAMLATAPLLTLLALTGSLAETVARLPEIPDFTAGMNAFAAVWGAALWRATWQAGLFALAIGLFIHVAEKHIAPRVRATLWWLVAVKAVVALSVASPIPVPVLPTPIANAITEQEIRAHQTITPLTAVLQTGSGGRVKAGQNRVKREAVATSVRVMPTPATALLCLWGAGVLCHMGLTVRQFRMARALVARAYPVAGAFGANVYAEIVRLAGNLGLNRLPEVRISPEVASPLLVGLSRTPTILLPVSLIGSSATALSMEELRLVLAHELAHMRRADPLIGILPAFASALFFFHPAVHRTLREFDLAREAACDAAAIAASGVATDRYGALLVRLSVSEGTRGQNLISTAVLAVASGFAVLRQRLILLQTVPATERCSWRSHLLSFLTFGVMALLGIVPWRMVATPGASVEIPSSLESVASETTTRTRALASGSVRAKSKATAFASVRPPVSGEPAQIVSLATPALSRGIVPLPLAPVTAPPESTTPPVLLALAEPDEPKIDAEHWEALEPRPNDESREPFDQSEKTSGAKLAVASATESESVATLLSDARFVEADIIDQARGRGMANPLSENSTVVSEVSVSPKSVRSRGAFVVRETMKTGTGIKSSVTTAWSITLPTPAPASEGVAEPDPVPLPTLTEISEKLKKIEIAPINPA